MLSHIELLNRLDHGQFNSGQVLADVFGVTRATIHNCILRIEAMGISVERVRGKGYRLVSPLDMLSDTEIKARLTPSVSSQLQSLDVLQEVDSTNNYIGQYSLPASNCFSVVLAESQTGGKGRRGRHWVSPYAANIYMSVLWPFKKSLIEVGALSPLLAVSVVESLSEFGVEGLAVKWPNDIYCHGKKLAGLLIECSGEVNGATKMIIGLGVNVRMSERENALIDQPWTDVLSNIKQKIISRNEIIALLLNQIVNTLDKYESLAGDQLADACLVERWARWDIMQNRSVVLEIGEENIYGVAEGIDASGCLLLKTEHGEQSFTAGDVSLRTRA